MRILNPIWFAAATLAIPILAMYMLKLRRKEIEVSSTLLWTTLLRDRQANTPWQKLKRNLLLFLQLLILAALVFSLVRPAWLTPSVASGSVIVILDGSGSMNAQDEQIAGLTTTRFEAAQAAVRSLINELETNAAMTVILAANPPVVLANAEKDPQRLRQAVNEAVPESGAADWATTFAVAAGAASSVNSGLANDNTQKTTIVIVSDGGLPASGLPPLPGEVRFLPVGKSANNLAISTLAIRPLSDDSSPQEIFASVTNYSAEERQVVISFYAQPDLSVAPVLFQARQLTLPVQATAEVALSEIPADVGIVTARLSAGEDGNEALDVFPLDDTAFAVSPRRRAQRIFLLSRDYLTSGVDNQFILRMLFALGHSPFRPTLQGEEGQRIAQLPADPFDLYILDGALPVDASGQPVLPPSGSLLLINPPPNALISASGVFTPTSQASVADHPLTTYLDWRDVYVASARAFDRPTWAASLVTDSGSGFPLVLAGETGGRRVAALAFDLHASDLPLHVTYPVLMNNLLNYLLPPQSVDAPLEGVAPNATVTILAQADIQEVAVGLPDGSLRIYNPTGQSLEFSETGQTGLYTVNTYRANDQAPAAVDYFAVNLFDAAESDIAPRREVTIGQTPLGAALASTLGEVELWPWVALAALVILLVEWWIYHRPAWRRGEKAGNWLAAVVKRGEGKTASGGRR